MTNILDIHTEVRIYENSQELDATFQQLLVKAKEATASAYAPYSKFKVGAALLLENGEIVIGSNQENASFSVGLCAERVALSNKATQFPDQKIVALAVAVENPHLTTPVSPCGVCRQSLFEFESRQESQMKILLSGPDNMVYELPSVESLLPLPFSPKDLQK